MLSITLGGQQHMLGADGIHGEMDLLLRPIQQGALAYCGFTVLPPHIGYHVPYVSQEDREKILASYQEHLLNLDRLDPLCFPSLESFDEKLRPKASPSG